MQAMPLAVQMASIKHSTSPAPFYNLCLGHHLLLSRHVPYQQPTCESTCAPHFLSSLQQSDLPFRPADRLFASEH